MNNYRIEPDTLYIYALLDPRTDAIRYVGMSKCPEMRLRDHRKDKANSHKTHWIQQLKQYGIEPKVYILEECDITNWQVKEQLWISGLRRLGYSLTNTTDGGEGAIGLVVSIETREKLAASRLGRKFGSHSEETKRKIGLASKGRECKEEVKDKLRQMRLGSKATDETRQKMSARHKSIHQTSEWVEKRTMSRRGCKMSVEAVKINSECHKGIIPTAETRLKQSLARIGRLRSEETKQRISEGQKKRWAIRKGLTNADID